MRIIFVKHYGNKTERGTAKRACGSHYSGSVRKIHRRKGAGLGGLTAQTVSRLHHLPDLQSRVFGIIKAAGGA
jgi:hypothetical protein